MAIGIGMTEANPGYSASGEGRDADREDRWWSSYARMYDRLWSGELTDRLARTVIALAGPPRGVTADIGCGTGLVTQALVRSGHHVIGVDSNPAMARLCAARLSGTRVVVGSIDDPPLRRRSVRTVVATNVLHLHRNPVQALEGALEVLEPAGQIIFSWPSADAGPRQVASAELRAGMDAVTVAARTCGRVAMALRAPRSLVRKPARSLQLAIADFARGNGFTMKSFNVPAAQQTLVVLRECAVRR